MSDESKYKCPKHPKYKGKKEPKYKVPCIVCIAIYIRLNKKPRLKPLPTKVIKDKTKYSRKKKHKKDD